MVGAGDPGAGKGEGDGAERGARPVERGGIGRVAEVVEGGIADEDGTIEGPGKRGIDAEERDDGRGHAGGVEQADDVIGEEEEDQPDGDPVKAEEDQRIRQSLPDARIEPCADVLPHDRPYRAGQREEGAKGDRHQPAENRPSGHGAVAVAGDHRRDDAIAEGRRDVGEDSRDSNGGNRLHVAEDRRNPRWRGQTMHQRHAPHPDQRHGGARDDRGDRRTIDPEAKGENEDRVEDGGHDAAHQRHPHRPLGIADGPEDRRVHHAEAEEDGGGHHHPEKAVSDGQGATGRTDGREDAPRPWQHRSRQHDHGDSHDEEARCGEAPGLLAVAGAERAGHQRRPGDRNADGEGCQEEQHRAGVTDGGGQFLFAELGDVEEVEKVDEEHRHQTDRTGQGHDDDMAHRRALRELARHLAPHPGGSAHPEYLVSSPSTSSASGLSAWALRAGSVSGTGAIRCWCMR